MQGTVRHFDASTGAGDVLLDTGHAVSFPATAFAASGLRLLRVGQRVRLETDATGAVTLVTIATLPAP